MAGNVHRTPTPRELDTNSTLINDLHASAGTKTSSFCGGVVGGENAGSWGTYPKKWGWEGCGSYHHHHHHHHHHHFWFSKNGSVFLNAMNMLLFNFRGWRFIKETANNYALQLQRTDQHSPLSHLLSCGHCVTIPSKMFSLDNFLYCRKLLVNNA